MSRKQVEEALAQKLPGRYLVTTSPPRKINLWWDDLEGALQSARRIRAQSGTVEVHRFWEVYAEEGYFASFKNEGAASRCEECLATEGVHVALVSGGGRVRLEEP